MGSMFIGIFVIILSPQLIIAITIYVNMHEYFVRLLESFRVVREERVSRFRPVRGAIFEISYPIHFNSVQITVSAIMIRAYGYPLLGSRAF